MKPGSYSTQKLAAEAAAMEARLTALKLELQKDKAKREAAAAAASAQLPGKSSIWGNGQQGPLRRAPPAAGSGTKAADKTAATAGATAAAASRSLAARSNGMSSRGQPIHAGLGSPSRGPSTVKPPPARTAAASSSFSSSPSRQHSSKAPSASSTRPTSTSSTASTGSLDTRNNDTSTKSAAAKPRWLQQLKQQQQEASSPAQVIPAQQQAAGDATAAAAAAEQQQHMHGASEEGSCTSADLQGPSLLHGTYNEAEAAGSFQAALRQWRDASPAGSSAGHSSSCAGADSTAGSSASGNVSSLLYGTYDEKKAASSFQEALRQWRQAGPAGASTSSSDAEVPKKLVRQHTSSTSTVPSTTSEQVPTTRTINTSVAAFLQKLTVRSSPPADIITSSSPATQAASLSTLAASGTAGSVTAAACTLGVVATAQYSLEELAAAGPASVPDAAEATAAADCVDCEEECSTDTGSTGDQAEPFDAWLEQAEAAAAATLASSRHHSGASSTSNVHLAGGSNSRGSSTESGQTGSIQYQQQLDNLLDSMEQLELELKERTQPVQVRVHVA